MLLVGVSILAIIYANLYSAYFRFILCNSCTIITSTKMKFCGGYVFGSIGLLGCLFVCLSVCLSVFLLAGLLKSYERISMKFSGSVGGSTRNNPLDFRSYR